VAEGGRVMKTAQDYFHHARVSPGDWRYTCLHIPSGKRLVHTTRSTQHRDITRVEFFELLDKWNRSDPDTFRYWSGTVE